MLKFFKDFLIYGTASVLGKLIAIFLIPLYTNILTREEYGAMALITACKGIIDLFSNLNIHSGIVRDYYEPNINRKELVSSGLYSIICCSLITLILMLLFSHTIVNNVLGIPLYYSPFIIMLLSIPTGSLQSYLSILTRFLKKPTQFAIGGIVHLIIQVGVSVFCIVYLRIGIIGVFLGVLLGEIFSIGFFGYLNRHLFTLHFNWLYVKRALVYAVPMLPAVLAGWIDSSLGQIIIGKEISLEELAPYSLALQIASVFTLISTAFQNVWSPFLYENYKNDGFNQTLLKLFKTIVWILVVITLSFSIFSKEIVLVLSNEKYIAAAYYFPLLCIPMCLYLLFPIVGSGISITRETKHVGISYCVGSAINIIALIIFIPLIGVFAVPLSLAFSRVFTFSYMIIHSHKRIHISFPISQIFLLCFVSIVCYFIQYNNLGIMPRTILFIIAITLFFLFVKKSFDVELIHIISSRLQKK